jgi:hypothetical protein
MNVSTNFGTGDGKKSQYQAPENQFLIPAELTITQSSLQQSIQGTLEKEPMADAIISGGMVLEDDDMQLKIGGTSDLAGDGLALIDMEKHESIEEKEKKYEQELDLTKIIEEDVRN